MGRSWQFRKHIFSKHAPCVQCVQNWHLACNDMLYVLNYAFSEARYPKPETNAAASKELQWAESRLFDITVRNYGDVFSRE